MFGKHIEIEQVNGAHNNSIDIYVDEIPALIKLLHTVKNDYVERDKRLSNQ